jgi:hypothetical protein
MPATVPAMLLQGQEQVGAPVVVVLVESQSSSAHGPPLPPLNWLCGGPRLFVCGDCRCLSDGRFGQLGSVSDNLRKWE